MLILDGLEKFQAQQIFIPSEDFQNLCWNGTILIVNGIYPCTLIRIFMQLVTRQVYGNMTLSLISWFWATNNSSLNIRCKISWQTHLLGLRYPIGIYNWYFFNDTCPRAGLNENVAKDTFKRQISFSACLNDEFTCRDGTW